MKNIYGKHYVHSDDSDFEEKVKKLLVYRKIIKAEMVDDQTALLTLDNGTEITAVGNEGCSGCGNGWYYLDELNNCDNVITSVECVDDDGIYHLFVFADNTKINCLQYSGGDNGYYGTGYDIYVKMVGEG